MAFPRDSAYHADSDADDEFERSIMASPSQAGTDSETETSSEPRSNQHTPTTYGTTGDEGGLPKTIITEWTTEECAQFLNTLNLQQYRNASIENGIDGQALVALKHEELKEMGISSLGHRLTILKKVWDIKVSHDVPVEPDDYVPLSEQNPHLDMATLDDIDKLASIIRLRDERILEAETQLTKLANDYRKLREELLPIFKLAKERSEPLPQPYGPYAGYGGDYADGIQSPPITAQPMLEKTSLTRNVSKKLGLVGNLQKIASPTHIPSTIRESRPMGDPSNLNPSAAANQASSQLSGAMHQQSPVTSTLPSPTSPSPYQPLSSGAYSATGIPRYDGPSDAPPRSVPTPTPQMSYEPPRSAPSTKTVHTTSYMSNISTASTIIPSRDMSASVPPPGARSSDRDRTSSHNDSDAPSVEIFKSFRVALEDPCYKVLPAALRKYNIQADWRQYALYIVYGDQERCVGLEEKPLALFKDLDKEGKRPMFMLRKLGNPVDTSHLNGPASAGLSRPMTHGPTSALPSGVSIRSMTPGNPLPGGVL